MADVKTVKCGYKHCWHESREILRDSAIKISTRYYHADCASIKYDIEEAKRLYYENIDKNVSIPLLVMVLNNLVFIKGVNTKYILFGLNYWIRYNKNSIKSPFTLYYIENNKVLLRLWDKENKNKELT